MSNTIIPTRSIFCETHVDAACEQSCPLALQKTPARDHVALIVFNNGILALSLVIKVLIFT